MTTKEMWKKRLEKFNNDWVNSYNWPRGTICVSQKLQANDGSIINVALMQPGVNHRNGNMDCRLWFGTYSIL